MQRENFSEMIYQNGVQLTDNHSEQSEPKHVYGFGSAPIELSEQKPQLNKTKLSSSSSSLHSLQLSEYDCDDSDHIDYGKRKIRKIKMSSISRNEKLINDKRISMKASVNVNLIDNKDNDSNSSEYGHKEMNRYYRVPKLSSEKRKILSSDSDSSDSETKPNNKTKYNKIIKIIKTNDVENNEMMDNDISANILIKNSASKLATVSLNHKKLNENESVIEVSSDSSDEILVKNKSRKLLYSDSSFKWNNNNSDTYKKGNSTKGKAKRRIILNNSSDDEVKITSVDDTQNTATKSRKNIRNIVTDEKLKQKTKDANVAESERMVRIAETQKLFNQINKTRSTESSKVNELILEFDITTQQVLVELNHTLVSYLKPHQVNGIKFMYDCTIEQLANNEGSGCIVAHSMGLGKTLQVICYLHTILTNKIIKQKIKTALVICPVNAMNNWVNEFKIWLNNKGLDDIIVFEMNDAKSMYQRANLLNKWKKSGGVMIIGLSMFSIMIQGGRGKKQLKSIRDTFETCLLNPGADIVVVDEGHLLKNDKTAYNQAVSKIRTLRRIVLTGTPLQNNLMEYYVMVNFVKPNLLGTKHEFTNRFVNPITNGQHKDSTELDVKIMKKRVHILHKLLDGCVYRCDYKVLTPYLQPKFEYVLSIKLSETQISLYRHYLDNLLNRAKLCLFADYGCLRLVWNHPMLLFKQHRRKVDKQHSESEQSEHSLVSFINDETEETLLSTNETNHVMTEHKTKRYPNSKITNNKENDYNNDAKSEFDGVWFNPFINIDDAKNIDLSGKFIILFSILEECERMGDKLLVFTQSLDTLDLVEEMLGIKVEEAKTKTPEIDLNWKQSDLRNTWVKNKDYFRIDGSTRSHYRKAWIDIFNDENNDRSRLFLLSTKAGGLGINLVGANRCIIFDASWNPTHDIQALFRVYRFGQKKPVYIYRFLAQGSMEEKIYDRQIVKQSLSCRVVDEQQIERHFKSSELSELYAFDADRRPNRPTPILPKDRLLAELLIKHKEFIVTYHEHDSLLENRPEEDLTEYERQNAWIEYEREKQEELRKKRKPFGYRQQQANRFQTYQLRVPNLNTQVVTNIFSLIPTPNQICLNLYNWISNKFR